MSPKSARRKKPTGGRKTPAAKPSPRVNGRGGGEVNAAGSRPSSSKTAAQGGVGSPWPFHFPPPAGSSSGAADRSSGRPEGGPTWDLTGSAPLGQWAPPGGAGGASTRSPLPRPAAAGTRTAKPAAGTEPARASARPDASTSVAAGRSEGGSDRSGVLQVMSWTCGPVQDVEPQALPLTYWFDAVAAGDPYSVSVRFTGRRLAEGDAATQDRFEVVQTLPRVVPGSGRIALSTYVHGIPSGRWQVTAQPVPPQSPVAAAAGAAVDKGGSPPLPVGKATGSTIFLPVARARVPGARLLAWPSLVAAGAAAALVSQFLLAEQRGLPAGRLLAVGVVASLLGLAGARIYYLITHPEVRGGPVQAGMSVQGFILGAIGTLGVGAWWVGVPIGPMLDVTAPGLLFGLMIGRLGCFFGGCCAGRPTASRWGLWSSDRVVGVRRIPVQLMESTLAGVVAVSTLVAVLLTRPMVGGLLFVAGLSAYLCGRQLLFPLRGIPRKTSWGRLTTLVLAAAVLATAVAWLVVSAR